MSSLFIAIHIARSYFFYQHVDTGITHKSDEAEIIAIQWESFLTSTLHDDENKNTIRKVAEKCCIRCIFEFRNETKHMFGWECCLWIWILLFSELWVLIAYVKSLFSFSPKKFNFNLFKKLYELELHLLQREISHKERQKSYLNIFIETEIDANRLFISGPSFFLICWYVFSLGNRVVWRLYIMRIITHRQRYEEPQKLSMLLLSFAHSLRNRACF